MTNGKATQFSVKSGERKQSVMRMKKLTKYEMVRQREINNQNEILLKNLIQIANRNNEHRANRLNF